MRNTFDPVDAYAVRTVYLGGLSEEDDYDPEQEAYWDSLLAWVDAQKD